MWWTKLEEKVNYSIVEEGHLPLGCDQCPYFVQVAVQPGTWLEGLKSIPKGSASWDSFSQNFCQRCMPCMSVLPERWSQQGKQSHRGLHAITYVPAYLQAVIAWWHS